MMVILSIFPGIDLLGRAFEEVFEDACIVRGPDELWGGDIRNWHVPSGVFTGIIGGPPCQYASRLRGLVEHNHKKHPEKYKLAENLIPEYERIVREAQPAWFLMENVPTAGIPSVPGYEHISILLNNRWLGEQQNRLRRFTFGFRAGVQVNPVVVDEDCVLFEHPEYRPAVLASGTTWQPVRIGGSGKVKRDIPGRPYGDKLSRYLKEAIRLQGLPEGFLDDAPFTVKGKLQVVGNGVPLPMGRAIARAVKRALGRRSLAAEGE